MKRALITIAALLVMAAPAMATTTAATPYLVLPSSAPGAFGLPTDGASGRYITMDSQSGTTYYFAHWTEHGEERDTAFIWGINRADARRLIQDGFLADQDVIDNLNKLTYSEKHPKQAHFFYHWLDPTLKRAANLSQFFSYIIPRKN
ncbi:MAG: hypothetical protein ACRD3W_23785 [Terriglobales bacterium]